MQTVERYLDELFSKLPQTEVLQQEKQRMQVAVRKEYDQLIRVGVDRQTAVARIMNGLRSVENQVNAQNGKPYASDSGFLTVDRYVASDIIKAGKANAFLKAFGVGALILGVAASQLFDAFSMYFFGGFLSELMESFSGLLFLIAAVLAILSFSRSKKKKHQFDFLQKGCNINREGFDKLDHFVRQGFDLQKALIVGTVLCVLGPMISSSLGSIPLRMSGDISDFLLLAIESAGVFVLVYRSQIKKLMDRIHDILRCGRKTD